MIIKFTFFFFFQQSLLCPETVTFSIPRKRCFLPRHNIVLSSAVLPGENIDSFPMHVSNLDPPRPEAILCILNFLCLVPSLFIFHQQINRVVHAHIRAQKKYSLWINMIRLPREVAIKYTFREACPTLWYGQSEWEKALKRKEEKATSKMRRRNREEKNDEANKVQRRRVKLRRKGDSWVGARRGCWKGRMTIYRSKTH